MNIYTYINVYRYMFVCIYVYSYTYIFIYTEKYYYINGYFQIKDLLIIVWQQFFKKCFSGTISSFSRDVEFSRNTSR